MRTLFRIALATVIGLAAAGCVTKAEEPNKADIQEHPSVEVMPVTVGSLVEEGNYYGALEPHQSIMVSSEIGGKLAEITLDKGDSVAPGTLLFAMDDEPFVLAQKQAETNKAMTEARLAQLETAIAMESKQLDSRLQQAQAAVAMAEARLRLIEKGARPEEKKQAKAASNAAKAARDNAKLERDRVQELFDNGAATQQQLDGVKAGYQGAEARHEQARQMYRLAVNGAREEDKEPARASVTQVKAGVDGARAAMASLDVRQKEVEVLKKQIEVAQLAIDSTAYNKKKARVSSPLEVEGVVANRFMDNGEMVGPGAPVFELLDTSVMKLVVSVPGNDVWFLKKGATMPVHCTGDKPRQGVVRHIGLQAHAENATFPVEIDLKNPDGTLRSGLLCETFPALRTHSLVLVPRQVILDTEEGKVVMVAEGEVVRERPVTVGAVRGSVAAIEKGLEPGDKVVVIGERQVRDGEKVVVHNEHDPILSADGTER
jgi:RND family efflux transporter MFP subunit